MIFPFHFFGLRETESVEGGYCARREITGLWPAVDGALRTVFRGGVSDDVPGGAVSGLFFVT